MELKIYCSAIFFRQALAPKVENQAKKQKRNEWVMSGFVSCQNIVTSQKCLHKNCNHNMERKNQM